MPFSKFEFVVMWLFRECCAPYLFVHALCHPSIRWRTLEFRLSWGGRATAVQGRQSKDQEAEDPAPSTIQLGKPGELGPLTSSHLIS